MNRRVAEGASASELEAALESALAADSRWRGRARWVDAVGSTNEEVLGWLAIGAQPPCVLLAESQQAGRGRRGRVWQDRAGESLLLSIGWAWPEGESGRGLVALAAGLALARLAEAFGLRAQVKWPNDLLLGERKAGGVLVEAPAEGAGLCVGIGLNVRQTAAAFGGELAGRATSMAMVAGPRGIVLLPRPRLAAMLLEGVADALDLAANDPAKLLAELELRLWRRGRRVRLLSGDEEVGGVLLGLDAGGQLRLGTARGERVFAEATLRGE